MMGSEDCRGFRGKCQGVWNPCIALNDCTSFTKSLILPDVDWKARVRG